MSQYEQQELSQLQQTIQTYTGIQQPAPEPPMTMVIECNKSQAQADGNLVNPNTWTNTFPAVKLKKGDVVSVNSAFLSNKGSGDLLQFDETNNKTRIIFEYYGINDNTNNKQPKYNVLGTTAYPSGWNAYSKYTGTDPCAMNCLPVNYRPMRLYRLMKTFSEYNTLQPTIRPVGGDLIPFTNENSARYTSPQLEANWGHNISALEVVADVEDDYVPGLFRNPTITIKNFSNALNKHNFNSADFCPSIWYISTQKSFLYPCSGDASMRIHGIANKTGTADPKYDDTLNWIKSLRPGMIIRFMYPETTFGFQESNEASFNAPTKFTRAFGPQVYICDGYKADGNGHEVNGVANAVDKFSQVGHPHTFNNKGAWKTNPMGMYMKVVRTYYNAQKNNVGNHGSGANVEPPTGPTDIQDLYPYVEVACAGAISMAWGHPNQYSTGLPQGNGLLTYPANSGLLASAIPPVSVASRSEVSVRTYMGTNTRPWFTSSTADGATYKHAGFFPDQDDKEGVDGYLGFIPKYFNKDISEDDQGVQLKTDESSLSTYITTRSQFDFNALGIDANGDLTQKQKILPINYNTLTKNKDFTLTTLSGDLADLKYGKDYKGDSVYAGGRLPFYYQDDPNDYDTTETNYIVGTRRYTYNFGNMYKFFINDFRYSVALGGTVSLDALITHADFTNSGIQNKKNNSNNGVLPTNSQNDNHKTNLFVANTKGQNTRFYIGNNITTDVFDPTLNSNIIPASGDFSSNAFPSGALVNDDFVKTTLNANIQNGTENFIICGSGLPLGSNGENADGTIFYGYETNTFDDFIQPAVDGKGFVNGVKQWDIVCEQYEKLVYIKMTDPATNTSEVMYVQILTGCNYRNPVGNTGNTWFSNTQGTDADYIDTSNIAPLTANSYSLQYTMNLHYPTDPSQSNGKTSPNDFITKPRFIIIQRDVLNTGKVNFTNAPWGGGTGTMACRQDFVGSKFRDPDPRGNNAAVLVVLPTAHPNCPYFEIFNSMSDMEHLIQFKDCPRDLIPTNPSDPTMSKEFYNSFGGTTITGAVGGDFVWTTILNQPKFENGITRMTDNTIWLSDREIGQGTPDSVDTNDANNTMASHLQGMVWDIHYDYKDVEVDPEVFYYSQSDVATTITKQLHEPSDIYKQQGGRNRVDGIFPHSKGKYPVNEFFRPIHGPSGVDNTFDPKTGYINGNYTEGDFCFFVYQTSNYLKNVSAAYQHYTSSIGVANNFAMDFDNDFKDGLYPVWIRNPDARLNIAPTTQTFKLDGWTKPPVYEQIPVLFSGDLIQDNSVNNPSDPPKNAEPFNSATTMGVSILGQFVGAPNPTLTYNVDNRFEWSYLHSPTYSEYGQNSGSTGGDLIANLWYEPLNGLENWDRSGGVNIVNWTAPITTYGSIKRRATGYQTALNTRDTVGQAFMNKLGFSNKWLDTNTGSTNYLEDNAGTTEVYKPLGTTRSDYDLAQSISYEVRSNVKTKYPTLANIDPFAFTTNDLTNTALNGLRSINDKWWGEIGASGLNANPQLDGDINKSISMGFGALDNPYPNLGSNDDGTSKSPNWLKVNWDDRKMPYRQVAVASSSLTADELASKSDDGYFLIMSDLIDKHEFIGSANGGQPLNCIGVLSKNYESNDFYFSFQSPVEFYIKSDRTITSITTRILTPNLQNPGGLNLSSSIIYSIQRQNNIPELDVPPISLQQTLDYEVSNQLATQNNLPMNSLSQFVGSANSLPAVLGGSSRAVLNTLRQQLVQQALRPTNSSQAEMFRTEGELQSVFARMPLRQRLDAMRTGLGPNPADESSVIPQQLGLVAPQVEVSTMSTVPQVDIEEMPEVAEVGTQMSPSRTVSKGTASDSGMGSQSYAPSLGASSVRSLLADRDHIERTRGTTQTPLPINQYFENLVNTFSEEERRKYTGALGRGLDVSDPSTWEQSRLEKHLGADKLGRSDLDERAGGVLDRTSVLRLRNEYDVREDRAKASELTSTAYKQQSPLKRVAQSPKRVPYSGGDGKLSLYDAVARTTKFQTTEPKQEHFAEGKWFVDGDRNKDGNPKSKGNKERNENPFDIHTWTNKRLNDYRADPFFSTKKNYKGRFTTEHKLSAEGYEKLNKEVERRPTTGRVRRVLMSKGKEATYDTPKQAPPNHTIGQEHTTPRL